MSQEIVFVIGKSSNTKPYQTQIAGYKNEWVKRVCFDGLDYSVAQILFLPNTDSNSVLSLLRDSPPSKTKLGRTSMPKRKPIIYYAPTPWMFHSPTELSAGNCCLRYKWQDSYYSVPISPLMTALTLQYRNQNVHKSEKQSMICSLNLTGIKLTKTCAALAEPFVVLSGSNFSHAFQLNVKITPIGKSENIESIVGKPTVNEISVEVLELITTVKFKKGCEIKRVNKINSGVVFWARSPFQVNEELSKSILSNLGTFEIPSSSYSFPIPHLEPTFFTSSLMRS